jgi:hypothetical protein
VFRRGRDLMSRIVLASHRPSRYSHVGVVVSSDLGMDVIHSLPGDSYSAGVRREALAIFMAEAEEVGFYRLDSLAAPQRIRMRQYLTAMIGIPFDYEFRLSDAGSVYCTELVLLALRAAGVVPEPHPEGVMAPLLTEPAIPPSELLRYHALRKVSHGQ